VKTYIKQLRAWLRCSLVGWCVPFTLDAPGDLVPYGGIAEVGAGWWAQLGLTDKVGLVTRGGNELVPDLDRERKRPRHGMLNEPLHDEWVRIHVSVLLLSHRVDQW